MLNFRRNLPTAVLARIARRFEDRAVHFVQRFEFKTGLFGVVDHGSQLVHGEEPAVEAAPLLFEEDWTWRCQLDSNSTDAQLTSSMGMPSDTVRSPHP